jgi:hypothetical protein
MPRDGNSDQKIHSGQRIRVAHERQIDEIFDRASTQLDPDAIVGALRICFGWTLGNFNTKVP